MIKFKNFKFSAIFLSFTILIILFLHFGGWKLYPVYGSFLFQDWMYIYDYWACLERPDKTPETINEFCHSVKNANFVYPRSWQVFALNIENRELFKNLIFIFIITYIWICTNILKKYDLKCLIFFLFSPVSILILQRGNIDLIIIFLTYLFYVQFKNKKFFYTLIPYSLSILLKIYTVVLLPLYYFFKEHNKNMFMFFLICLSLILLFIIDLDLLLSNYNKAGLTLAFNSAVLFKIFNQLTNYNLNYQFISIFFILILFLISLFNKVKLPKIDKKYEISFLIGSSIIVSSFFLNEGFVYKLIFLIFVLPLIIEYKKKISTTNFLFLISSIFLSLWIEYLTFIYEIIFDLNLDELKQKKIINLKNFFYGVIVMLKNFFYWNLNILLIFISTKILIRQN